MPDTPSLGSTQQRRMTMHHSSSRSVVVGTLLMLASCSVPMVTWVNRSETPQPTTGYLAGWFETRGTPPLSSFEFDVVDAAGRFQGSLDFVHPSRTGLPSEDKTLGLIALPPGEYRIRSWGPASTPIPSSSALGRPFSIRPGEVVFLGRFSATRTLDRLREVAFLSFRAVPLTYADAREALTDEYQRFAQVPMECLLCNTGPGGAPGAARVE